MLLDYLKWNVFVASKLHQLPSRTVLMTPRFFLACSFDSADRQVIELLRAIADGLGMPCVNVHTAYRNVPPAEARRLISDAAGVIAVATRRIPGPEGTWLMPDAVHDEIAIAYALRKPLLLFREADVRIEGYVPGYGTYLTFDRSSIQEPANIKNLVEALAIFRSDSLSSNGALPTARPYFSESIRRLCELVRLSSDTFTWSMTTTNRLIFREAFAGFVRTSWWCSDTERTAPADAPPMEWSAIAGEMSRPFEVKFDPRLVTADTIDLRITLAPDPQPNDFFEFTVRYRSPYLNPIFADARPRATVKIDGQDFFATDGLVPTNEIRRLRIQWRFPAEYGVELHDVKTFVGGFANGVDDLNEPEMKRAQTAMESFAGNLVIDMSVDDPLMRHKYGVAWRLPVKVAS
jgi:hypothetical protein